MRPKAAYLDLEHTPDLEFEFYLAERLGRTVAELRAGMSSEEFGYWSIYYGRKAQRAQLAAKG